MLAFMLVIGELLVLFFLSQRLTRHLYSLLFFIFRSKYAASSLITFIYLPGTAIHELSHLIMAEILRVPTGELSFTPVIGKNSDGKEEIKAGSLKVAQTDPLRRFLIGFAPVLAGLFFLCLLVWLFQYFSPQFANQRGQIVLVAIIGYFIFAISNSMFSSRKDMEGSEFLLPVLFSIIIALYIAGVRIELTGKSLTLMEKLITGLSLVLGLVIGINALILGVNLLLIRGFRKFIRI